MLLPRIKDGAKQKKEGCREKCSYFDIISFKFLFTSSFEFYSNNKYYM